MLDKFISAFGSLEQPLSTMRTVSVEGGAGGVAFILLMLTIADAVKVREPQE